MKKIINLTIFLVVICVISSTALYFSNNITSPIIAKNKQEKTEQMLKELIKDADQFSEEIIDEGSITTRYLAQKGDETIAYVYEVKTYGFQSEIVVLVAINNDGDFSGFQVIEQAETPGFGTQIVTNEKYRSQFTTKNVQDELDTISGSTVTTKPLNEAIAEAVAHFKANN